MNGDRVQNVEIISGQIHSMRHLGKLTDNEGNTPLHLLVQYASDDKLYDGISKARSLAYSLKDSRDIKNSDNLTPLELAVKNKKSVAIIALLAIDYGDDRIREPGDIIRFLQEAGIEVEKPDKHGHSVRQLIQSYIETLHRQPQSDSSSCTLSYSYTGH